MMSSQEVETNSEAHVTNEHVIRILMEYLTKLREEILQAQKLRMQAMAGKIVFLGGLFSYFLKNPDQSVAIVICPFVALLFDYMIFGFTYNIRIIGSYIEMNIEDELSARTGIPKLKFWESSWTSGKKVIPWGRFFRHMGNYGVTFLAGLTSFTLVPFDFIIGVLIAFAIILYIALLSFEFKKNNS